MTESPLFPCEITGSVLIVTLQKRINGSGQSTVVNEAQVVADHFSKSEAKSCVVDFGQLDYFTSTLLEGLLRLWDTVKSKNGKLILCNLSPVGNEIIKVAHFDRLWLVCGSREDALQAAVSNSAQ